MSTVIDCDKIFVIDDGKIITGDDMEVKRGFIKEVYIPVKENDDIYSSNQIGFKIQIDNKVIKIEEEQNSYNTEILKNDEVNVIRQTIDGKEFIDIEKVDYNE